MAIDKSNDIWRKLEEHEALLEKQVYISEGHIVINVCYEYNVPIERCNSPEKLLGWIVHLCEKTWMTTTVLERFAQVAAAESGFAIEMG